MSKTKATGTSKLGRDSIAKRLGIKLFNGQKVKPGSIIVRQRGTRYLPGKNAKKGADDTIYAVKNGFVLFSTKRKVKFNGQRRSIKIVNIVEKMPA